MSDTAYQTHYQGSKPPKKANGKRFKQAPVQVTVVKTRKPKGRGK